MAQTPKNFWVLHPKPMWHATCYHAGKYLKNTSPEFHLLPFDSLPLSLSLWH